jgi:hypothetical protein
MAFAGQRLHLDTTLIQVKLGVEATLYDEVLTQST